MCRLELGTGTRRRSQSACLSLVVKLVRGCSERDTSSRAFPIDVTVRAGFAGTGNAFVLQVHYLKGSGRLRLPPNVGKCTTDAARVALSWVMLHMEGAWIKRHLMQVSSTRLLISIGSDGVSRTVLPRSRAALWPAAGA